MEYQEGEENAGEPPTPPLPASSSPSGAGPSATEKIPEGTEGHSTGEVPERCASPVKHRCGDLAGGVMLCPHIQDMHCDMK